MYNTTKVGKGREGSHPVFTLTSSYVKVYSMCTCISGEDRWLCTLLLQQGWRVEYNAASDAFTNAPQEFKEFYNQRRRWGPSTLANTLDLLHRLFVALTDFCFKVGFNEPGRAQCSYTFIILKHFDAPPRTLCIL